MNSKQIIPLLMISTAFIVSCGETKTTTENPFLTAYDTPFGVPPFDKIKNEHFKPALEAGMEQHEAEIDAIVNNAEDPTFENTILALEDAGQLLSNVNTVLGNLNSANTNDSIQAIVKEMAPVLSAHQDNIRLNERLFARVKTLWDNRADLDLNPEQLRLLEDNYKSFVRGGANLQGEDKDKLRKINEELAVLTVQFNQNLLAETNAYELVIENERDLAGLPEGLIAAAAETAKERGKDGKWVFTLSNPSVMPFLQYADNRDLRKHIWEAYKSRGDNGNAHDNKEILVKIANLRLQRANLLGYPTHAHYVLEEAMAENPDNVYKLLNDLWRPALAKAKVEAADIKQEIAATGQSFAPAPYDWRYYTEKIRQKRYALNEDEIKPYFSLKHVREGAFDVANRLYGLTFKALDDVPVYHPEVEVYEVFDADGSHLGVLYADFFPRQSKRVGAWMTSYRRQKMEDGKRVAPIISIVCNFTKPVGDKPALLTFDEASTLFHEFGHALHGLLSNVTYERLSGTSVSRDFVELPSQIMENWAADPAVLKLYAHHFETGEPIPDELIAKLERAGTFDQGFATVEYLAASLLDMDYHTQTAEITDDATTFENASMTKYGLIDEIIPRYRSTYFQHIFSGGYSAGYYSYIWAEVLDADAFAAFKEKSLFDKETADAFRQNVLERGGTEKPAVLYRNFRGSDPNPVHLMKKRGLD
ncbi:peptidyl-dipeptidase Dcp [Parapedobacter luteus]|uniref:Peptidyl-dipeptidase Dcp n=1 Tax=Parapedobacter luteus TaxID=623280 RepID=A0A1T5F983_9SPHI|nr:M3 family metallopeptidase [Parapedobacter luteus]SKB92701.1 peptidyl-dipeptidase Dcp [Parapedobacter luteus]